MNLAIIHYHLNRGGVAQVIANQIKALCEPALEGRPERVAILYGGRRHDWPDAILDQDAPLTVELVEIAGLEYDDQPRSDPAGLAESITDRLLSLGFDADDTVLHAHNHALGKNASLPGALALLSQNGYRQLLQIHDFPEDSRPENYIRLAEVLAAGDVSQLPSMLYPQSPSIHYAALNRRDRHLLSAAGVAEDRLHLIPNAVGPLEPHQHPDQARAAAGFELNLSSNERLVVYPVRGIRRKNLGEMVLLSALDPGPSRYAITLPPLNPAETGSYHRWRSLANTWDLPCLFGIGGSGRLSFPEILGAADALLTTSLAEGFGMVYLESWLVGRNLLGRNLPDITRDFVDAGLRLDQLYDRLRIPLGLIDVAAWREALKTGFESACRAYHRPCPLPQLQAAIDELSADQTVDFAYLSSRLQQNLIDRVRRSPSAVGEILGANEGLDLVWKRDREETKTLIADNLRTVRAKYGLDVAGARLCEVYQAVLGSPAGEPLGPPPCGEAILDALLNLRQLHPVRLESCHRTSASSHL